MPGSFKWKNQGGCRNTPGSPVHQSESISFGSGKTLSIVQDMEKGNAPGQQPQVVGELILQAGSSGKVEIDVITNDKAIEPKIDFKSGAGTFKVTTPTSMKWTDKEGPCVQMRIVATIPKGSDLKSLTANVVGLQVDVENGLDVKVSDTTTLKSVAGGISAGNKADSYSFGSRSTIVETVSGSIGGWFALYDSLKLHSVSGSIKADVSPKDADASKKLQLDTKSQSGSTILSLLEPVGKSSGKALSSLTSNHNSVAGSIQLTYPGTWEGKFTAKSVSGSTKFSGNDVVIDKKGIMGNVQGHKGEGDSQLKMATTSGSIKLAIGKGGEVAVPKGGPGAAGAGAGAPGAPGAPGAGAAAPGNLATNILNNVFGKK